MNYSSIKNVLNLFLFSALGFSVQLFEKKKIPRFGYSLTLKCSLVFYKHNFHKRRRCAPLCVRVKWWQDQQKVNLYTLKAASHIPGAYTSGKVT